MMMHSLNLTHLIGTDTLKPYMHGHFLDLRLYTKAKAIANPFAYAEHREKLIREKLEKEQESRIRGAKKSAGTKPIEGVKVNRSLAKKAREEEERIEKRAAGEEAQEGERKRKKKNAVETPSLLKDSRFGALFTNADYQIDEDSREFALLNPSTKPTVCLSFPLVFDFSLICRRVLPSKTRTKRTIRKDQNKTTKTMTTALEIVPTTEVRFIISHFLARY